VIRDDFQIFIQAGIFCAYFGLWKKRVEFTSCLFYRRVNFLGAEIKL